MNADELRFVPDVQRPTPRDLDAASREKQLDALLSLALFPSVFIRVHPWLSRIVQA
jgi:hypothetical protein